MIWVLLGTMVVAGGRKEGLPLRPLDGHFREGEGHHPHHEDARVRLLVLVEAAEVADLR